MQEGEKLAILLSFVPKLMNTVYLEGYVQQSKFSKIGMALIILVLRLIIQNVSFHATTAAFVSCTCPYPFELSLSFQKNGGLYGQI